MNQEESYHGWSVLELLGHRRVAGYVTEQTIAGAALLRVDIPLPDGATLTQFYAPASLYAMTPVSEEAAHLVAAHSPPQVLHSWELPRREPTIRLTEHAAGEEGYPDVDDDEHYR